VRLLLVALLCFGAVAAPEQPTPYERAVQAYRAEDFERAVELLTQAIESGEESVGYYALLGWTRLRRHEVPQAVTAFSAALSIDAEDGDPWKGLGLARQRSGDHKGAREAFGQAVQFAPGDAEAARLLADNLSLIIEERRFRPPVTGEPLRVDFRTGNARLEVRRNDAWKPLFIKGINLGTALPGKFPAQFPDDPELYAEWFRQMAEMGANVVRLYTLHPPSLYRELARYNEAHADRPLWLVQGVWTELPAGDDYDSEEFSGGFHAETRRVIDAIHGNVELPPRPGHADGVYDTDLSRYVLAWLLGREWEPHSVLAFNEAHPKMTDYVGDYVRAQDALPIEAWLASICDYAARHESQSYASQRPIAITSWPTLDPLHHPTEANAEEELVYWRNAGDDVIEIREYENDRVNVDVKRLVPTERFHAGIYAAYHAYPYYPEFMVVDPRFAEADDGEGTSRYLGYLRELKRHHGEQPVVIAEFGVPSSRGIAHLQPEGQHHGGHTERAQGEIDARLLRNIHQAELAGGIVFAWIDEWFKRNWLVMNYESPRERNPLWFNALDAEQNYGLIAARPGATGPRVVLDGKEDDWEAVSPLYRDEAGPLREFSVTSDEAFVYLRVLRTGPIPLWIGVDTYDAARGDSRFPPPVEATAGVGMEFLLQFSEQEARILVARSYDLFSQRNARPYRSQAADRGDFVEIRTFTNRARYGRDGTFFPARGYSRSPLRAGNTDPRSVDFDSLADWFVSADGKLLEARIPWGLLNVADPSSHQVIHETEEREGVVQTRATDGFRFHLLALKRRRDGDLRILDRFPAQGVEARDYPTFLWPAWEQPTYRLEPKPSYDILREAMQSLE